MNVMLSTESSARGVVAWGDTAVRKIQSEARATLLRCVCVCVCVCFNVQVYMHVRYMSVVLTVSILCYVCFVYGCWVVQVGVVLCMCQLMFCVSVCRVVYLHAHICVSFVWVVDYFAHRDKGAMCYESRNVHIFSKHKFGL